MKPCFGYIRVSTQKQGEGVSLEAQQDAITVFASQHNLQITKWFEEKQTAAKGGRPQFNQMLRELRRSAAAGVIIHKVDRAARNPRDWAMFTELPDIGIEVFVATESVDFNSRGGRLTMDIQAVIAADYVRNLREETIKGLNGRLKQGLYPFRAPIGYRDNGKGKPKTPDPMKAPLIREMFELYASGQYSLRSLQSEINRCGLRNHNSQPLSLHGVETILNNTFYTGLITIARTGATYEGVHEPLISTKLFRRVQSIKSGRSGPKVTRQNHLFRGLFRCAYCSGAMTPERQKGRCYYRCQRTGCPTATIREDRLEEAIVFRLRQLELEPDLAARLKTVWEKDAPTNWAGERATALQLRVAEQEKRQERLTDLLIDGTIDPQAYRARHRAGQLQLSELKEQLANLPDQAQVAEHCHEFLELMKNLCLLYQMADPPEKRDIVENAFSNRTVAGKYVELEPYDWLQRHETALGVLESDPERYRDTDLAGVPAGVKSLEHLISLSKRKTNSLPGKTA